MPAYINAIGTAVPKHCIDQQQIASFMCNAMHLDERETRKLKVLYRHTKIKNRHSVISDYSKSFEHFKFYPNNEQLAPFPTILPRMLAYRQYALPLATKAIENCLSGIENFDALHITHLITVSCTGMYALGFDIDIVQKLGLNTNTKRTCINFMGCYGVFNALKLGESICNNEKKTKVLIVSVELCTLHFQKVVSENNLLSNALFADGSAAVLIENKPSNISYSLKLKSFYCDLFTAGNKDMEWNISDFGFEMTLTSNVPKIIKNGINSLYNNLLTHSKLTRNDISLYAMHPGGRAILEVIETALGLTKADNNYAYEVLENYGNMSSATVLFVLQKIINNLTEKEEGDNILSCAFGPGLTLESMILEVVK